RDEIHYGCDLFTVGTRLSDKCQTSLRHVKRKSKPVACVPASESARDAASTSVAQLVPGPRASPIANPRLPAPIRDRHGGGSCSNVRGLAGKGNDGERCTLQPRAIHISTSPESSDSTRAPLPPRGDQARLIGGTFHGLHHQDVVGGKAVLQQ